MTIARVACPAIVIALTCALSSRTASAFPPYRSTDAGTAEPWTLEARLGVLRVERQAAETRYTWPLLRANLGLPGSLEVVSEVEAVPAERRLADAALGIKWVPFREGVSFGIETLGLPPVSRAGGGGVESTLVATVRAEPLRLHANAGVFYDARPDPRERGFQASLLTELTVGRFRPGLEGFARRPLGDRVQVLAGPGLIVKLGPVDVRAGVHVGLTAAAPDFSTSLWVSDAFSLR